MEVGGSIPSMPTMANTKQCTHIVRQPYPMNFQTRLTQAEMITVINQHFDHVRNVLGGRDIQVRIDSYGSWQFIYIRDMTADEILAAKDAAKKAEETRAKRAIAAEKRKRTMEAKEIEQLRKLAKKHGMYVASIDKA